ncbi:MAG: hypothetical protein LBQ81_09785 [Zoogloeaceae bacterium]|jgi:hypothetical protein|nr:hypothetical protein [Zoogloeaceae bacterium]
MSTQTRITAVAEAIGGDIKTLLAAQGALANLTTTAKGNLVAALNELKGLIDGLSSGSAGIDDAATTPANTWSASKIAESIATAVDNLVNGAPDALDTLKELADYLDNNETLGTSLVAAIGNRVRYDAAQAIDTTGQAQARANIGAAAAADVGDTDHDFVADYNAAKA